MKSIAAASAQFIAVVFLVAGLSLAALFIDVGRLIGPVGLVADKLKTIAEGEGDLTAELPVSSSDEIGILSASFNSVMTRLKAMIAALKAVSEAGAGTSANLASHSQELSATMTEVAATMRSVDSKNGMLHGEILRAESSLEGVESSASLKQTAYSLEGIDRSTSEKRAQTEGLALAAQDGEAAMGEMVSAVAGISVRAQSISEMMDLLDGIAQQTGLLAMNAAIEAAHAGDAGKGFAVVAEEIRRLAEATSENSAVAAKTLTGIVDGIGSASSLSAKASELIGGIIRGAGEVSSSMQDTLSGLQEVATGSRQHRAALERLVSISSGSLDASRVAGEGAAAIRQSFSELRSLAEEKRAGISEITAGLGEAAEAAGSLAGLGTETSRGMSVLEAEIGKFKIG